jgi:hypothetical protein
MFLESLHEKYKTVQSFKPHFLQNSPLVQLYTSVSDCKGVGNIPGSHFMKDFSARVTFFMMSVASQKHCHFNADFKQLKR